MHTQLHYELLIHLSPITNVIKSSQSAQTIAGSNANPGIVSL